MPEPRRLFGSTVQLADGGTVTADEAYLRESILQPAGQSGRRAIEPIMPTFQGLVTEDRLVQLIEYIKSMARNREPARRNGHSGMNGGRNRTRPRAPRPRDR